MANYLMKYKGKYRLMANIDKTTNDFPRDEYGNIETDDIYIKCAHGNQIYHYGHSTLIGYIPSLGRGHNVLRAMAEELLNITDKIPYDELYQALEKEGTIQNIRENDTEIEFSFKNNDIEFVAKFLKPCISGANISPFSVRNLPKTKYTIPNEDLAAYKKIVAEKYSEQILALKHMTEMFFKSLASKNNPLDKIKADMKLKGLKGKEYIHRIGEFDEYLSYLRGGS